MNVQQRADRAKAILNDPLFKEACDVIEYAQVRAFTDEVCGPDQLMEAHRMVRALKLLKGELENVMITGKLFDRQKQKGQHRE
jgi:hypothetical protein